MIARACAVILVATVCTSAVAKWRPATPDVTMAATDPDIAAVMAAIDVLDGAVVSDDRPAFEATLAEDLVVNTPQNRLSKRAGTRGRAEAGLVSYSRYDRSIEYAGKRGPYVLVMGEESIVPKGAAPDAGHAVRRRFTDLWQLAGDRWQLTARQATVIGVGP